jgi:hypothetical protein
MNSNFNRQFIQIDFALLDDPKFLEFVSKAEFATYLVLRRYIWRGGAEQPHFLGLHDMYEQRKWLACSLSNRAISKKVGLRGENSVTKVLRKLEDAGVIKRIRTGRQTIFLLGEWVDYSEKKDGSLRLEWFYLEQKFGVDRPDQSKVDWSDQSAAARTDQSKSDRSNTNRKRPNREENSVNGGFELVKRLPSLAQPAEKSEYVARELMLKEFKDNHSLVAYRLIAAKVPEHVICRAISEIKADGARTPVKVFMHRMKEYAKQQQNRRPRSMVRDKKIDRKRGYPIGAD